jgi:hypothetical protein
MTVSDPRLERLKKLQREYQEMESNLPAHSVPASMLLRLEELEDEIRALQSELALGDSDSALDNR